MPSSSEVEHLTVNQNVAGSIPAQAANGETEQVASPTDCKSAV